MSYTLSIKVQFNTVKLDMAIAGQFITRKEPLPICAIQRLHLLYN